MDPQDETIGSHNPAYEQNIFAFYPSPGLSLHPTSFFVIIFNYDSYFESVVNQHGKFERARQEYSSNNDKILKQRYLQTVTMKSFTPPKGYICI